MSDEKERPIEEGYQPCSSSEWELIKRGGYQPQSDQGNAPLNPPSGGSSANPPPPPPPQPSTDQKK